MTQATGTFEVISGNEETYHDGDGEPRLTIAGGDQRFSGDIQGSGSVKWCMCYLPTGGARFVGIQRIEGSIDGHKGSFLIESVGDHDGRASRGSWKVVAGSGTGDLSDISGTGSFEAPGGPTVSYTLDYTFVMEAGEARLPVPPIK